MRIYSGVLRPYNVEADLMKYYRVLADAKDNYNCRSYGAKNPKYLQKFNVLKDRIEVELASELELAKPALALQTFSKEVAENAPELAVGRRVFVGEFTESGAGLSDTALLQKLVEIVLSTSSKDREFTEKIREEVMEYIRIRDVKESK